MIRDPEWNHVREQMQAYPHWDGRGGLEIFALGPERTKPHRKFQHTTPDCAVEEQPGVYTIEGESGFTLSEILGQMLCIYFDEMSHDEVVQGDTAEWYESVVDPHFQRAKEEIGLLLTSTDRLKTKGVRGKLASILRLLEEVEPRLRHEWVSTFSVTTEKMSLHGGNLNKEGAEQRLIINLWDCLTDFTDLTLAARKRHVVELMAYFEVISFQNTTERLRHEVRVDQLIHGSIRAPQGFLGHFRGSMRT